MSEKPKKRKANSTAERYRNDPAFQELQKKRARLDYFKKKPVVGRPPIDVFHTEYYTRLPINNPHDLRCGMTVRSPIYKIGSLAKLLGISVNTVLWWIKVGKLPEATLAIMSGDRPDRGYTYDQLRVIWELRPLLNFPVRADLKDRDFKGHNPFSRMVKKVLAEMPDGVVPLYETPA